MYLRFEESRFSEHAEDAQQSEVQFEERRVAKLVQNDQLRLNLHKTEKKFVLDGQYEARANALGKQTTNPQVLAGREKEQHAKKANNDVRALERPY